MRMPSKPPRATTAREWLFLTGCGVALSVIWVAGAHSVPWLGIAVTLVGLFGMTRVLLKDR